MDIVPDFQGVKWKYEKIAKEIETEISGMPLLYNINGAVDKFSFRTQTVMPHLEAS